MCTGEDVVFMNTKSSQNVGFNIHPKHICQAFSKGSTIKVETNKTKSRKKHIGNANSDNWRKPSVTSLTFKTMSIPDANQYCLAGVKIKKFCVQNCTRSTQPRDA